MKKFLMLGILVMFLIVQNISFAWWNSNWQYRKNITYSGSVTKQYYDTYNESLLCQIGTMQYRNVWLVDYNNEFYLFYKNETDKNMYVVQTINRNLCNINTSTQKKVLDKGSYNGVVQYAVFYNSVLDEWDLYAEAETTSGSILVFANATCVDCTYTVQSEINPTSYEEKQPGVAIEGNTIYLYYMESYSDTDADLVVMTASLSNPSNPTRVGVVANENTYTWDGNLRLWEPIPLVYYNNSDGVPRFKKITINGQEYYKFYSESDYDSTDTRAGETISLCPTCTWFESNSSIYAGYVAHGITFCGSLYENNTINCFIDVYDGSNWLDQWYTDDISGDEVKTTSTEYQLSLNVTYDSDMQADFDDLRFVDSDDTTQLSYWIEQKVDGSWAYVWVKVPSIPASSNKTIYMYYGNPTASNESNITAVFGSNLVSMWTFRGNANDVIDDNNGTVYGATLTSDRNGNPNEAYNFDGVDDYIDFGADSSLRPSSSITISAWFYADSAETAQGTIVSNYYIDGSGNRYGIIVVYEGSNDLIQTQLGDGTTTNHYCNSVAGSVSENDWHHLTYVFDGDYAHIYLDGSEIASCDLAATSISYTSATNLYAGKTECTSCSGYPRELSGKIDDLRIYNTSLSLTQINEFYADLEPTATIGTEETYSTPSPTNNPPSITLNSPANNTATTDTTPDFSFTATDDNDATFSCTLWIDDSAYGTNSSAANNTLTTITANASLSDGSHNWYINCTDSNSSTGQSEVRTIVVDTTTPTVTWIAPTPSDTSRTTGNSVTINISASDDGVGVDTCLLLWEGTNITFDSTDGTNWWSTKVTVDGTNYTINAYCNDSLGQWAEAGVRWFLENTAPTTPTVTANSPVDVGDTITATASGSSDAEGDTITYQYKFYNVDDAVTVQDWSTDNTYITQSSDEGDTIRVYARAYDGYEFSGETSTDVTINSAGGPTPDTTPPTITIASPQNTTYTTNTISIQVSADEAIDTWMWNLNGTNVTFTPNITIWVAEGYHTLWIYANDTSGNMGSASVSFTVDIPEANGSLLIVGIYDEETNTKLTTTPFIITLNNGTTTEHLKINKRAYDSSSTNACDFNTSTGVYSNTADFTVRCYTALPTGTQTVYVSMGVVGTCTVKLYIYNSQTLSYESIGTFTTTGTHSVQINNNGQYNGLIKATTSGLDTGSCSRLYIYEIGVGGEKQLPYTWDYTGIPNGNLTITVDDIDALDTYAARVYYATIGPYSSATLKPYLIKKSVSVSQVIQVQNQFGNGLYNADVKILKDFGNGYEVVEEKKTDSSGLAIFTLKLGDSYLVSATYNGETINQTLTADGIAKAITFSVSIEITFNDTFSDIYMSIQPASNIIEKYYNETSHNVTFNFTVLSALHELDMYGMSLYCNGTTLIYQNNVSSSVAGGSITYTYDVASCDNITMSYYFLKEDGTFYSRNIIYYVKNKYLFGLVYSLQALKQQETSTNYILFAILILIIVGSALSVFNPESAIIGELVVAGIFTYAGLITWNIYVIILLTAFSVMFIRRRWL